MSDKLETLTLEQEEMINVFYQRYLEIGFNADPVDKTVVNEINQLYALMNITKPPTYIWVKNPVHADFVIEALKNTNTLGVQLCRELEQQIDSGDYITTELIEKIKKKTGHKYVTFMDGSIDAYWISYCKFGEYVGVTYDKNDSDLLEIWDKLIRKCGFWYCYESICVVCDRAICKIDDNGDLHNDKGPAVTLRDDPEEILSLYCINGVEVPKKIVMEPDKITDTDIDNESNAEVRRIMIQQMGVGKYLEVTKAEILHMDMVFSSNCKDSDDSYIPRALMRDKSGRLFLVGTDGSTCRVYYMPVPNTVTTCNEAGTALAGFDESEIVATS